MGDVDELNSSVGLLIAFDVPQDARDVDSLLGRMEQHLLDLGSGLGIPGYTLLKAESVAELAGHTLSAIAESNNLRCHVSQVKVRGNFCATQ